MNAGAGSPVLFAYDGSDLAKAAIANAGEQLADGRSTVVLAVWEPLDANTFFAAGRVPVDQSVIDALTKGARETAQEGAELAEAAGFEAEPIAAEGAPTWKRIVDVADERDCGLIVLGSHGRTGVSGVLLGSVAATVARHSDRPVLIVH